MTQLDQEIFTSFQSALGALEQLSIISDTNAASKTTGDLESIPVDLKLRILKQSNLETCLALSESCDTYRKLWKSLDKTLVRQKVLRRVPWFELNEGSTGLTTWDQCAKTLVARTRTSLLDSATFLYTTSQSYKPLKSLEMLHMGGLTRYVRVAPTDVTFDNEARKKMNPMFPTEILYTSTDQGIQGCTLRLGKMTLNLKTLIARKGDTDYEDETYTPVMFDHRMPTPSGGAIRHVDPQGQVGYVNENDNLMHIKYTPVRPLRNCLEDDPRALVGGIIHKATHPRDADGCYVIDPAKLTIQAPEDEFAMPLLNLLPGEGGALIARFAAPEDGASPYLGYIEPTAELRHIVLCATEAPFWGGFDGFDDNHSRFCIFYNGFLYYCFEGRFFQLWVDLGYQKLLNLSEDVKREMGHHTLPQKTTTKALTAVNVLFPMLGTFAIQQDSYFMHEIIQGDKNQGMDRFVTLRTANGSVVGDLLLGNTYVCRTPKKGYQTVIPYIDNKKKKSVGFYSFSPMLSFNLAKNMRGLSFEAFPYVDMNELYEQYLEVARDHNVNSISRYEPLVPRRPSGRPEKKDFFLYPRRVHPNDPIFADDAKEYTNIDGDVELKPIPGKGQDRFDWDCGDEMDRACEDYDVDSEDEEYDYDPYRKVPATREAAKKEAAKKDTGKKENNGKVPSMIYRYGWRDGSRGRPDDRYQKQEYYKGYHAGYRAKFGYTDHKDKDDYWGTNPKHGKWYLTKADDKS